MTKIAILSSALLILTFWIGTVTPSGAALERPRQSHFAGDWWDQLTPNMTWQWSMPARCPRPCFVRTAGKSWRTGRDSVVAARIFLAAGKEEREAEEKPPSRDESDTRHGFTLIFAGFSSDEVNGIEEYLVEFPGYQGHRLVDVRAERLIYSYQSRAQGSRLISNLVRMLDYLGMDGSVRMRGSVILIGSTTIGNASKPEDGDRGESTTGSIEENAGIPLRGRGDPEWLDLIRESLKRNPLPDDVADPITLHLSSARGHDPTYRIGEKLDLAVELDRDGWLYCFYLQGDGRLIKFFPNVHHEAAFLAGGREHRIPGEIFPFDLNITEPPGEEMLTCFAVNRDVAPELPAELRRLEIEPLPADVARRLAKIFRHLPETGMTEARLFITVVR